MSYLLVIFYSKIMNFTGIFNSNYLDTITLDFGKHFREILLHYYEKELLMSVCSPGTIV